MSLVTAKNTVAKDRRCDSHKMSRNKTGLPAPNYPDHKNHNAFYNPIEDLLTECMRWSVVSLL